MLLLLDALRGLAALFVVLHHACSLLWRGEALDAAIQAGAVPGWALALLNPLDFVRVPVMLFFILSGFCIHYRQATSLAAWDRVSPVPVPSWSAFAWRRLIRLYPVLLFALALTLALDAVGRTANPALYANGLGWSLKVRQGLHISEPTLDVLLANLLMQAEIVRPHLGSNGPLWSLGMEFWFYVLYPAFFWLAARRGAVGALRLVAIISLLGLMTTGVARTVPVWLAGKVASYWVVWAAGAAIADAFVKRQRPRWLAWLGPLSLLGMAYTTLFGHTDERIVYDLYWSAALAIGLAYVMLCLPRRLEPGVEAAARRLAPLGHISYSLYATHYPLMVLTAALWLSSGAALPIQPALAAASVVASLALGAATWWAVERRTIARSRPSSLKLAPAASAYVPALAAAARAAA